MKIIARSVWMVAMFGVLVAGVQTLTANPLWPRTDPNPGGNPDPDYCQYMGNSQYYCTYSGGADCRVCTHHYGNTYSCVQVLCEFEEVIE